MPTNCVEFGERNKSTQKEMHMGIGDMLRAQQDAEDATKYRALQKPEKINQFRQEISDV